MRTTRFALVSAVLLLVLIGSNRWGLKAQEGPTTPAVASRSLAERLERRVSFPYEKGTSLKGLARDLRGLLDAQVVIDVAALKRRKLDEDAAIHLELRDVRLKTGLKLLLDQVGLTYRAIDDDGLLVITDTQGADDPLARMERQLEDMHKDIHEIQDAVEEVYQAVGPVEEGPAARAPRNIEEVPADKGEGHEHNHEPARTRPG